MRGLCGFRTESLEGESSLAMTHWQSIEGLRPPELQNLKEKSQKMLANDGKSSL